MIFWKTVGRQKSRRRRESILCVLGDPCFENPPYCFLFILFVKVWILWFKDEEEWLLYVFSDTVTRPSVPPHFPALVEEMLRHSQSLFDYKTQRRMWAHSIFFFRREARLLTLLSQAQKVSMQVSLIPFLLISSSEINWKCFT